MSQDHGSFTLTQVTCLEGFRNQHHDLGEAIASLIRVMQSLAPWAYGISFLTR